jgi:hypothetical protein
LAEGTRHGSHGRPHQPRATATCSGAADRELHRPPIYGTNYNPPYYKELLEHYGFALYFNQLFFKRSAIQPVQPIFHRKYNQLKPTRTFTCTTHVGAA